MANHPQDLLIVVNPTTYYYEVKWGGQPHGLQPGEQRIFPRFIAEHFAKYLATDILMRREVEHKKQTGKDINLTRSAIERPKVVATILTGVYSYFQGGPSNDPNAAVAAQIAQINQGFQAAQQPQQQPNEPKPIDIGEVEENPAIGAVEQPDDEEETVPAVPQMPPPPTPQPKPAPTPTPANPPQKKRTREQLIEEGKSLGFKVAQMNKLNDEDLLKQIQNF